MKKVREMSEIKQFRYESSSSFGLFSKIFIKISEKFPKLAVVIQRNVSNFEIGVNRTATVQVFGLIAQKCIII